MNNQVHGVRSNNNNVFVRSSYWGAWSRILSEGTPHNNGRTVEVNITAINGRTDFDWASTLKINIREHCTMRSKDDLFVGTLPEHVIAHMREWMDQPLMDRLLHEDFLPQIDWALYRKHNNGGAPFELIKIGAPQPV